MTDQRLLDALQVAKGFMPEGFLVKLGSIEDRIEVLGKDNDLKAYYEIVDDLWASSSGTQNALNLLEAIVANEDGATETEVEEIIAEADPTPQALDAPVDKDLAYVTQRAIKAAEDKDWEAVQAWATIAGLFR